MQLNHFLSPFATFALLTTAVFAQDRDLNWEQCLDDNPDVHIVGCTAVILSGQETDESLATAFNIRGKAYSDKLEYNLAIRDYDQATMLDPSLAAAFYNRGSAYYGKQDYDGAIQDYNQAIKLDPNYALAFENRGEVYINKSEYDRAIQDFDQAIRLDPDYAEAFNNRGVAFGCKLDYDRAIQDYDQAIRLNPSYSDAYQNRGVAYYLKKNSDRAIEDYGQAIRLDSNFAVAFANRGEAYVSQQNYDSAIGDYEAAIRLERMPALVVALDGLARIFATSPGQETRNGIQAVGYAQRAVALGRNNPVFRDTLAAAYAENGQFENAVEEQQRAILLLRTTPYDVEGLGSLDQLILEYEVRLILYLEGQPYRQETPLP